MRVFYYCTLIIACSVLFSCSGPKRQKDAKATAKTEVVADNDDAAAGDFIKDMYNNRKFEDEEFLKGHCSAALLKKLGDAYEYEGDGLASWLFRSGAQDGPSGRHEVIKVESQGDGWYLYEFYDMGVKGSHSLKLVKGDKGFTIEDLK